MSAEPTETEPLPRARLRARPRWSPIWLLPVAAVALSGWLIFTALGQRGIVVEVRFQQGHGIKPGDALRYRGIAVGAVNDVRLTPALDGVEVTLRIDPDAADLTRAGSRFWIVRPRLDLSGAEGLETVVGAKYLSVLPGRGDFARTFTGLDEPPRAGVLTPGGLEIILATPAKGSLRAGAPVNYRQVIIGTIIKVDLAGDASAVEARVYIEHDYAYLIRDNVRFWKSGGARFSAGLTGLSVAVDSVQSLILGGVELAIPPDPGEPVAPGHIFGLYDQPQPGWLEWLPSLPRLDTAGRPEQERPDPVAAILSWDYKNLLYLTTEGRRRGWLLPVEGGFLGPADLLRIPDNALIDSARLVLADTLVPLEIAPRSYADGLAMLPAEHAFQPWSRLRRIDAPEDARAFAAADAPGRFIAASRYRIDEDGQWVLSPGLGFDTGWHGAPVVSDRDGALIGILLVDDERISVARVAPERSDQ